MAIAILRMPVSSTSQQVDSLGWSAEGLEAHRPMLLRFIRSRVRSPQDAEDIVQTAMYRAVASREGFRGDCPASQWMLRIAINELRRHYSRTVPKLERTSELDENLVAEAGEPDSAETAAALMRAAKTACSDKEFAVLLLVYKGRTLQEISGALDMSFSTVRSHFLRGRANLLALVVRELPELVGGKRSIDAAILRAQASMDTSDRLSSAELIALHEPRAKSAVFRSACLKLAKFLPTPAGIVALLEVRTWNSYLN